MEVNDVSLWRLPRVKGGRTVLIAVFRLMPSSKTGILLGGVTSQTRYTTSTCSHRPVFETLE